MSKNEKIVKNYVYDGLGFPIILENALFHKVRGEWLLKIDVEKVADLAFKLISRKPAKLTGDEIKFIRTYLGKSKPAFAELFKLSHTAVTKWENAGASHAPISPSQEIVLRLYIEDYLNVGDREFYKAYKSFESFVHNSNQEEPLKIAV
jgi:DNA-binding transcriptional regulator YiaG